MDHMTPAEKDAVIKEEYDKVMDIQKLKAAAGFNEKELKYAISLAKSNISAEREFEELMAGPKIGKIC